MEIVLHENFCKNLRDAMRIKGLSQTALGKLMDARPQYVNDYLHGRMCPGLDVIERFAEALEVPGSWLIDSGSIMDRIEHNSEKVSAA